MGAGIQLFGIVLRKADAPGARPVPEVVPFIEPTLGIVAIALVPLRRHVVHDADLG